MKIQTMSIVCGTTTCNAKCPYCVSKTTPSTDLPTEVNWRNFDKACKLAKISGATTVLLTGKGEPTLYPDLVYNYVSAANSAGFPFIELQTNGILFGEHDKTIRFNDYLRRWYDAGLNTICLSAAHYEQELNKSIYNRQYPKIEETVKKLHDIGYTVRLSIMMMKDGIEDQLDILNLIQFCRDNKIKQLTMRPLAYPEKSTSKESIWAKEHTIEREKMQGIKEWLDKCSTPVLHLSHGATVYDVKGQNVCLANCLTTNETDEDIRQIIFYPSGRIMYDWVYDGAILL
jgi:molybdenum cofactor biosynthesis enzyme MoaA